jgi:flagellar hook protein FlgE
MTLVRAMGSGLSGLNAQQFALDTIGNNLANATTTGFRAGRVEFSTLLSQTIRFGTAPQGQLGGVDPIQVGFGVGVAGVGRNFAQGELRTTGFASDLAIDGEGFFILRDGHGGQAFTRDGSFSINPEGILHDAATGYVVQGVNADYSTFAIPAGGPLEDLRIPVGNLQIAAQTTSARFDGNLNSGADLAHMGTLLQSVQLLENGVTPADANTDLVDLFRVNGPGVLDLDIDLGDTITVNAQKGGRTLPEARFFVGNSLPVGYDGFGTTLGDLQAFLQRALGINTSSNLHYGAIRDNDIDPNTVGLSLSAPAVFAPSSGAAWVLTDPAIADFALEGAQVGDIIRFNSGPGAGQTARITAIAGSSLTIDPLSASLPLPVSGDQYTIHQPAGVGIVDATLTPWLTDGALLVAGNAGTANAIENLVITNETKNVAVASFATLEEATGESVTTNAVVYDSIGNAHRVEFTFVLESRGVVDPSSGTVGNTWRVFAEAEDGRLLALNGSVLGSDRVAGSGQVMFTTEGQFLSQQAMGNLGFASFNIPNSGAVTPLSFAPDFSDLTGFANTQSIAFMIDQDGLATGILMDYSVGLDGIVTGIFSNGATRSLAQVQLARFQNANGLMEEGANLFRVGANSGVPIVSNPGEQGNGAVVGGALEGSNVDFAKEFSDLIVAQRAFQANARIITRSDQMLEELVNII